MAIGDFLSKFGVPGAGAGEFSAPTDIIVYNSEVYVVDAGNTRVQVFNLSGTYQREWSTGGTSPKGIAEMGGEIGEIYVTDSNAFADVVTVFSTVGVVLRTWGGWGTGDGNFQTAWDIASYNNEVYVADAGNNRIQVFNSTGVFQRKWGTLGAGDGQFSFPSGVAVYNDEVYVTDYNNNRIQVFSTAGVFQRKWPVNGDLSHPRGIEVWDDKVYVVDLGNDRCQVFDLVGTFITTWGTLGAGDGQFDTPAFLAINGATSIYVTDGSNARVQIFYNITPDGWTYRGEVLPDGNVNDIVSFGGEIYAGTYSSDASQAGVYRYDGGDVWTIVGTFREYEATYRFLVFAGDLYVGTDASNMPGTYYARVYKYMGGTTWTQVGGDIGTNEEVCSMCVFDGKIHIGTWNSGKVYRLDGGSWTDLGQVDSETLIYSLVDFGGDLFAGGYNGKVYKLVTGSWVAQSGNLVGSRLVVHDGELYGCHYQFSLLVYKYNGPSDWTEIGNFADGGDGELVSDGTDLYIGGCFGDDPWPIKFYKYLGTPASWEIIGSFETYDSLYSFKAWDGLLYVGMDGTVWSYEETTPPPPTPTNEELMRHLKWFHDGVFKGSWRG